MPLVSPSPRSSCLHVPHAPHACTSPHVVGFAREPKTSRAIVRRSRSLAVDTNRDRRARRRSSARSDQPVQVGQARDRTALAATSRHPDLRLSACNERGHVDRVQVVTRPAGNAHAGFRRHQPEVREAVPPLHRRTLPDHRRLFQQLVDEELVRPDTILRSCLVADRLAGATESYVVDPLR